MKTVSSLKLLQNEHCTYYIVYRIVCLMRNMSYYGKRKAKAYVHNNNIYRPLGTIEEASFSCMNVIRLKS